MRACDRAAALGALAMVAVFGIPSMATAQDPFEIQVYEYDLVPTGRWNLETHMNYTARGTSTADVTSTVGQSHVTFELTRGINKYFELAGYLLLAHNGSANDVAGWHVRPRVALPEDWLPVKVSISAEVGFPNRKYEPEDISLELRPILERSFGSVQVDLNPTLGRSLRGVGAADGWDFEPAARVGVPANDRVDLSLEYFGATGRLTDMLPANQQVHQIYPNADIQLTPDLVWNLGVGFGTTGVGNTLVYKMRLGWLF